VIVLLAVGAMFALAIRSAVASRAGTIEVGAVRERARAEREARAAVVIALKGLLPAGDLKDTQRDANAAGAGPSFADGSGGLGEAPEDTGPELPEFLKELIPELKDVEEKAKEDAEARRSGSARVMQGASMLGSKPRKTILGTVRKVGLPAHPVDVVMGDRTYTVELRDASGLLDINQSDRAMLVKYFDAVGLTPSTASDLADQIIDWRDTDSVPGTGGAEQEQYDREGIVCRNGPFESLEELRFLPAMTAAIFDRIRADLCLAGAGRIHVGSASREVLMALPGADADFAAEIIARREAEPITEKTLDEVIPRSTRKALRDAVRADPSSALAIGVKARETVSGRPVASLVGVAVVTDEGVRAVGVRAR
jgi:hypothetical protein